MFNAAKKYQFLEGVKYAQEKIEEVGLSLAGEHFKSLPAMDVRFTGLYQRTQWLAFLVGVQAGWLHFSKHHYEGVICQKH